MKAKISSYGELYLERGGKMKVQLCPFRDIYCGDHCPLFHVLRSGDTGALVFGCAPGKSRLIVELDDERRDSYE